MTAGSYQHCAIERIKAELGHGIDVGAGEGLDGMLGGSGRGDVNAASARAVERQLWSMATQATAREDFGAGAGKATRWHACSRWRGTAVLVREQGGAVAHELWRSRWCLRRLGHRTAMTACLR